MGVRIYGCGWSEVKRSKQVGAERRRRGDRDERGGRWGSLDERWGTFPAAFFAICSAIILSPLHESCNQISTRSMIISTISTPSFSCRHIFPSLHTIINLDVYIRVNHGARTIMISLVYNLQLTHTNSPSPNIDMIVEHIHFIYVELIRHHEGAQLLSVSIRA